MAGPVPMEVLSAQNGGHFGPSNAPADLKDIVSSPQPQAHVLDIPDDDNDVVQGTGAEEEPAEQFSGWLPFAVVFVLGHNWSNPVWRLRLIGIFCLFLTLVASAFWLTDDLREAHNIYQRVVFTASFGVPVAVATGSLVLSCCMAHNPNEWANWATWLSVANAGSAGGALILYFVRLHGD